MIRPAYVKCDATTGSRTVHRQVGPAGKQGELEVDVYLKDIGRDAQSQVKDPRISIWDRSDIIDPAIRKVSIYVDGQEIFSEVRVAYER